MKGITKIIGGLAIGTVNSALGAGGGMIAVPMLRKAEWSKQSAGKRGGTHYAADRGERGDIYLHRESHLQRRAPLSPGGAYRKRSRFFHSAEDTDENARQDFALFMLWAGVRMLMR